MLDINNCQPSKGCQQSCLLSCTQGNAVVPTCVTDSVLLKELGIAHTTTRNSDRLDFHDVHIASLRKVVERAYLDGRASVLRAQGVSEEQIQAEQSPADSEVIGSVSGSTAEEKLARSASASASESALHEKQWRNITKVVKALADLCFGSPNDPTYGHCHVAITTSLTAKDGLDVTALKLERLSS